jgi:hypothetical protein
MRWPAIALTALSLAGPVGAVDWKMYGGAEGGQVCFYDAVSIDRKPDGRLSIWTICHVSEDLENFAAKRSELIDSAARKIAANEYPPLALLLAGTSFDQMASMALEEQAADSDFSPEPKARILWELDCPKKRYGPSMFLRAGFMGRRRNGIILRLRPMLIACLK